MSIDWTINFSHILSSFSLIVAGIYAWAGMRYQVSSIVEILGRHDSQLQAQQNRLQEHEKQINIWLGAGVGRKGDND